MKHGIGNFVVCYFPYLSTWCQVEIGGDCYKTTQLSLIFEFIFERSYTLKVHTTPLRFNHFLLIKYPTFSCFLLLILLSFSTIWFCMQIWDKVRILNQTRAGVFSKKKLVLLMHLRAKNESYFPLSLYCKYVIAFLKVRLKILFVISPLADLVYQNTRNLQFARKILQVLQVSSSTSTYLRIASALGQLLVRVFYHYLIMRQYFVHIRILQGSNSYLANETGWLSVWSIFYKSFTY